MTHRVGYIRVSSTEQNTARQLDGLSLDKIFTDKLSGKDTQRPQLQACLAYLRHGDTLVVHSPDRLARSLVDLLTIVKDLVARGVGVEFLSGGLQPFKPGNGDDATNVLMLSILGAIAEFERSLIRARQREGVQIAKAAGKYRGRNRKLTAEQVTEIRKLAAERAPDGTPLYSRVALAKKYGVSRSVLYRYLEEARAAIEGLAGGQ